MTANEVDQAVADNENLVYFVIKKYFPRHYGDDDIIQSGRIGLWRACIAYDSARSKFSTFATRCIMNEVIRELNNREKLQRLGCMTSLDEPLYFDSETGNPVTLAHTTPDPEDGYIAIDYDLSFLNGKLSERDIEVFKMNLCGFTATEIGRTFGYTKAWASGIIRKARSVARSALSYT